ncbi:DNA-binding transcriptional regulator, LysR family [Nannocystis exedens]|uniref:DNA-binding transcriptional regulator, LysR family n=1 Tax=Nannocystis exedens TaxID=54 RepID=A0A1I1V0B0_9BACT|nr:LysR family transcriptional regulator [Nannocystis exedens]PCC72257.1 transcriptional regulator [Nannocystis exedens]SFD76487.1 DNA-binding transcriptional regulator, LysR family [Nannocystis exedens]
MSIEAIDLNLLHVLHLVLTERSVAGAARRLHVTPSAVSNALARLRDLLDDPIVTRKGRGIVPTPRAAELAPAIARALHDLDVALFAARFDPATCTRTFTLAVADAGQLTYVPHIARRMTAELPRARLRVVGIDSLVSLGDLAAPEVDVHIGIPGRGPGIHHEPLLTEHTVLIARDRHPATRARLTGKALASLRHVRVEMVPGRAFRDPVADSYKRAGVEREVVLSVPTFTAAAAVVAATDLVATVPASFARAYGPRFDVRALAGPIPARRISLSLSWHERTHQEAASIAFRTLIKQAMAQFGEDKEGPDLRGS